MAFWDDEESNRDWLSDYIALVEDCEARDHRLSEWEQDFLSSIREQLEEGRRLTAKQEDKLDSIWEKATREG